MIVFYFKKNLFIGYFINMNILLMYINIYEIKMLFKSIIILSFESDVSFLINNMIFYFFVICIIYMYIDYFFVRYSLLFLKILMFFFFLLINVYCLFLCYFVKNSLFY